MMYKLTVFEDTVYDVENCKFIPKDILNTDYQAYLEWIAEGNEPLPHDEPETTE